VKCSQEGQGPIPAGVPPRQLEGGLDRFGPAVGEEDALRVRSGRQSRQLLGQPNLGCIVEIGPRHVDQPPALPLDGRHDPGMRVPHVGDRDSGGEIKEPVAIHVFDHRPARATDHQRINSGV